jgi:K+-sensing histidine kinase KdpD
MREVFVCASDATPGSVSVLRCALKLAKASQARLVVLHVVEAPEKLPSWYVPRSRSEREAYRALLDRQILAARERLDQLLSECGAGRTGVTIDATVKAGRIVGTLVQTSAAEDASLVIVGRGRKAGPLAATTEHIVRALSRPVVLVPRSEPRGARVRQLRTPSKKPRRVVARAS